MHEIYLNGNHCGCFTVTEILAIASQKVGTEIHWHDGECKREGILVRLVFILDTDSYKIFIENIYK